MATLEQNPWYMEALERGLSQGRDEGLSQGRDEGLSQGRSEGLQEGILDVLEARFGSVPEALRARIMQLTDTERLHRLNRQAALAGNLADFQSDLI